MFYAKLQFFVCGFGLYGTVFFNPSSCRFYGLHKIAKRFVDWSIGVFFEQKLNRRTKFEPATKLLFKALKLHFAQPLLYTIYCNSIIY
jgi:hypothetical protein